MSSDPVSNATPSPRQRMAAIAIGVAAPEKLPFLAGAHNGARAFHEWALASGYESRLVTDEDEPVTCPRLATEFQRLLSPGPTHRLLIYFAGHGVIVEAEEGLWLLSTWWSELRAVAYEVLRRRLYRYGIEQIGIFADACRSLPADINTADLTRDAVLGLGPARANDPALDKFIAAQDGTATFAVPGPSPEDDRCLFSGVLLEGLWGTKPSAFSKVVPGKVTSSSLRHYLKTEVPALARRYGRNVEPTAIASFPEGDNYYYGAGPSLPTPVFPPWPPSEALPTVPRSATGGTSLESMGPLTVEQRLAGIDAPTHFETGAGFAIAGVDVTALWTPPGTFAEVQGEAHWWRVGEQNGFVLRHPVSVLIELQGGAFVGVTALPEFIGALLCDPRGAVALVYREVWADAQHVGQGAADALGRMERGGLRADAVLDEAVDLRQLKHVDPVLGAVSAYLYDSIGDLDNIRRMAFAYVDCGQAIPYDIAMLARLDGTRDPGGLLRVEIPEVAAREPRTAKEAGFDWTWRATRRTQGIVAGAWPWLRQGWSFLEDTQLVMPGLLELTPYLSPARFTTLEPEGARKLATLLQLERRGR